MIAGKRPQDGALIRSLQRATATSRGGDNRDVQPYAPIDEYAVKMFENGGRGIGEKGRDNGLLVLGRRQRRRVKWSRATNSSSFHRRFAGEVSRDNMASQFRQGNYGAGLVDGLQRIVGRIARDATCRCRTCRRSRAPCGAGASGGGVLFWCSSPSRDSRVTAAPARAAGWAGRLERLEQRRRAVHRAARRLRRIWRGGFGGGWRLRRLRGAAAVVAARRGW